MFKLHFSPLCVFLLLVMALPATAQKVKYKDVFALLNTKQYTQAEPFLKTFLKDNPEHSNAHLFMGTIYQDKVTSDDILTETDRAIQHMDSAILYYSGALKLLNEKELKRNREYYESYNRRDLSTGEFGVKLDYVQFDLEKRISGLKEQIDKIKMVKHYFIESQGLYIRSQELFSIIQDTYPGMRELYLQADEALIRNLSALSSRFDSCAKAFENYKVSLSNYGKTRYNPRWTIREIENFKNDGTGQTDFYKDDIRVWGYKSFADEVLSVIANDVKPVQDNLVKIDAEINKLRSKLEKDSVSVKSDLAKLNVSAVSQQIGKFDSSPFPLEVFAVKVADLQYKSTLIESKKAHASGDLYKRLEAVKNEIAYLGKADSAAARLAQRDLEADLVNYRQFVNRTFTSGESLKQYVNDMVQYLEAEMVTKKAELAFRTETINWLVNAADSIPLFTEPVVTRSKYRPLVVIPNKYTAGIAFADSVSGTGYFYNITPTHKPDIKVSFPIDKTNLREKRLPAIRSYITADPNEQIFFTLIYLERKDKAGKYPATVAKIYKSDGLSWSNNFTFDFIPSEISFVPDTGELVVKSDSEATVRIDKNGKVMK